MYSERDQVAAGRPRQECLRRDLAWLLPILFLTCFALELIKHIVQKFLTVVAPVHPQHLLRLLGICLCWCDVGQRSLGSSDLLPRTNGVCLPSVMFLDSLGQPLLF